MSNKPLKVVAGAPDRPLIIGDIEIPCYVLEDETRVLSQGGFARAIGRTGGPKRVNEHLSNLPTFLQSKNLNRFISNDLITSSKPINFRAATGGSESIGYTAIILPQVCEVYLKARDSGALMPSQKHIAERADILMRGLATVGIIALVDEVTGYQKIREQRALATILKKFISEELQPWTRTFPYEFYQQIFRLKRWPGPDGVKKPSVIGHYTNDIVYARIAPGVLEELRNKNPTIKPGRRSKRHHQWFTPNFGHPRLREHLAAVIALMKASANWSRFRSNLNRALPKINDTFEMNLDAE